MKKTVPIAVLLITLVSCIVASPQIALHAAKAGFNIWWSFIFPVLLPMYMLINLCHALGLFHSLGSILISIFRIKNISASQLSPFIFRWFMGSTYISPIMTSSSNMPQPLSKKALMGLLALSYNANPIFIIVIVFTAFVPMPLLGAYITSCIVTATLICALYVRLRSHSTHTTNITHNFIQQLELGRKEDGRPIGKLLGEGIYESVQQLFLLGGILLFSSVVAAYLQLLLPYNATFNFLFIIDQHLASYALLTSSLSTPIVLICIIALLSFGGLTQLFIAYGFYKEQQLPFKYFLTIRIFHSLIVIFMLFINYNWLENILKLSAIKTTFLPAQLAMDEKQYSLYLFSTSSFTTAIVLLVIIAFTLLFKWNNNRHHKNKQA